MALVVSLLYGNLPSLLALAKTKKISLKMSL